MTENSMQYGAQILPHKLFQPDRLLYTQHNGIPPEPARSFVPTFDTTKLDTYFDPESRLIFTNPTDLYSLANQDILAVFQNDLSDYYDFVTENLKQGHGGLFNCHRWPHIERVTMQALALAERFGEDEHTKQLLTIAGGLHDVGNVASRSDHDQIGASLIANMYPALSTNFRDLQDIQEGIYRHNEGPYRQIRGYNGAPTAVRLHTLQSMYTSDIAPLLFIADKADIDPRRVEQNALHPEVLALHNHSEVNMFLQSRGVELAEDGLTWTVAFDQRVPTAITDKDFSAVTRETSRGPLLMGTEKMRYTPDNPDSDIDPMKIWKEAWSLYGPSAPMNASRITGMIDCGLLFTPQFNIRYVDAESGEILSDYRFTQEHMDEEIANILA